MTFWQQFNDDRKAYKRAFMAQGFWALQIHRFGAARRPYKSRLIRVPWGIAIHVLIKMSEIFFGIYLGKDARIGRRLVIEHFGSIIVHNRTVIGDDVTIRQGVTIGMRNVDDPLDAPVIGSRVDIGAGAKILGKVLIGDDASIGANAVVLTDVPAGCLAVGVPAIIKQRSAKRRPSVGEAPFAPVS